MVIRVISLNTWAGHVGQPLIDFVKNFNADIYCLQEVLSAPAGIPTTSAFSESDPDFEIRPHLFEELQEALPHHLGIFSLAGQGPVGARSEYQNVRYGLATFVRRDIPILESRTAFIFHQFNTSGWGEQPRPRVVHMFRAFDYRSNREFVIAHLHGLWDRKGKADSPDRKIQLMRLLHHLRSFSCFARDKTVLCGDFNVLPESLTLRELKKVGLRELVTERGFFDTRTSLYTTSDVRYADYMFVSMGVKIKKFQIPGNPEVSDHRPLVLEFD